MLKAVEFRANLSLILLHVCSDVGSIPPLFGRASDIILECGLLEETLWKQLVLQPERAGFCVRLSHKELVKSNSAELLTHLNVD